MSTFIISLADTSAGLSQLEGKGASLADLTAAELPVPDGFYITTAAYELFVLANNLRSEIAAALLSTALSKPATLEKTAHRIRAVIAASIIPDAIHTEIAAAYAALGGPAVAVFGLVKP